MHGIIAADWQATDATSYFQSILVVRWMPLKEGALAGSWQHPGGKLRELGPASLSEAELLATLISPGIKGRPAEVIAADLLDRFGSLRGLANQPLEKLLEIKGLADVKIIRLAAALELARRLSLSSKEVP